MFTLAHERNEMKYVWMKEEDYVFAKADSLVHVPYVEPLFGEFLKSSPWFKDPMEYESMIWTMLCVIGIMICSMCNAIVCCVQNVKYDDSC